VSAQPLQTVFGNVLLARDPGDAWAAFRVQTRSYESAPLHEKEKLADELRAFCHHVSADLQIVRVSRRWDVAGYAAQLASHAPRFSHRELWLRHIDQHRVLLEHAEPATPMVFVCVRLAEPSMDLTARAARLFERDPREWLSALRSAFALRAPGSLDPGRLAEIYARAELAEQKVLDWLDARPARLDEIEWLIRRSYTRGLGEPEVRGLEDPQALTYQNGSRPIVIPRECTVLRWMGDAKVERHDRYLRVTSELGVGYQAGLCVGHVDHAEPLTAAAELMFTPLEDVPFAVDACLNLSFMPNDQALRKAQAQVAKTDNQEEEEEYGAHGPTGQAQDRTDLARELQHRLAKTREPILRGTFSVICGAGSRDELERRLRLIRTAFDPPLHRPLGDQLELFLQHFPGQRALTLGYEQPYTPEQIGAMVPHATHAIGADTPTAVYLGYTIHGGQPVRFDLREASDNDTSPTIALLGSQGSGKTTLSLLLLYQGFLQGARIVDIDPKGDHRFHLNGEVAERTRAITLGPSPEYAGMLDPLRVAPANERLEAATAFLIDVLPQPVEPEMQAAITGAVKRTIDQHRERACCLEVINQLSASDADVDRRVAGLLSTYCDLGLTQLGFARLEQSLPAQTSEQVTYLQIRALPRPQPGTARSEMGQDERIGRAVLRLLALYAMRILGEERDRLKLLNFDEAWFLFEDSVGRRLITTLSRWGRSELAVALLSSQLILDIEDAENLIGHWFLFGMRSRREAAKGLGVVQLDSEDPRLLDSLTHYSHGRCLYRDLRGRTEEIQVDLGELARDITTTPEKEPGVVTPA
jgi:hypothetical protein